MKSKITLKQYKFRIILGLTLGVLFGGLFLWVIANTLGLGKEFVIYPLILATPNAIVVAVISYRKARRIYSFPEEDRSLVSGKQ